MIKKLFNHKKNYTQDDFLKEVLNPYFNDKKLAQMLESGLDINWQNEEGESYVHLCAKKNLQLSLEWLLKNGIDKTLVTNNSETAIFYAVLSDSIAMVQFLMKNGFDINVKNRYGRSVLQEAIITDKRKVVDFLIKNLEDINSTDLSNKNVAFDAFANGSISLITKIINQKNINLNQVDMSGNTLLHQPEVINNEELSVMLLEAGADPRIKDARGRTFLDYIVPKGEEGVNVVKKVVALNYDLNHFNSNNSETLLMKVVNIYAKEEIVDRRNSLLKMIMTLVTLGISLYTKDRDGENVLFYTVKNDDLETTHFILEEAGHTLDVNEKNNSGDTVLSIAIEKGAQNIDMVVTLLKFKANPNIKNAHRKSVIEVLLEKTIKEDPKEPNFLFLLNSILENSEADLTQYNSNDEPFFFEVITHKRFNLLKLFRKYGFDMNQDDLEGNNVIHSVIKKFRENEELNKRDLTEILMFLITNGVDINTKDSQGRTALHNAIVEDWVDIIKFLLDAKADIHSRDNRGRSLAHCCVWKNDVKNFKQLHSYDFDVVNTPDEYGILPINYAAFMGHKELVIAMLESGAYVNNTNPKNKDIVMQLNKHSQNLDKLIDIKDKALTRRNISVLVDNMKDDFSLENI